MPALSPPLMPGSPLVPPKLITRLRSSEAPPRSTTRPAAKGPFSSGLGVSAGGVAGGGAVPAAFSCAKAEKANRRHSATSFTRFPLTLDPLPVKGEGTASRSDVPRLRRSIELLVGPRDRRNRRGVGVQRAGERRHQLVLGVEGLCRA